MGGAYHGRGATYHGRGATSHGRGGTYHGRGGAGVKRVMGEDGNGAGGGR